MANNVNWSNNSNGKGDIASHQNCHRRMRESKMFVRVYVYVRPCEMWQRNRMPCFFFFFFFEVVFFLLLLKNLQFKSIGFFHFAIHIFHANTYRSLWKFILSLIGIGCRKILKHTQFCIRNIHIFMLYGSILRKHIRFYLIGARTVRQRWGR